MTRSSFLERIDKNTRYWLSMVSSIRRGEYAPLDADWPNLLQAVHMGLDFPETRAAAAELWAALIGYVKSRGHFDAYHAAGLRIACLLEDLPPETAGPVGNELGFFFHHLQQLDRALDAHLQARAAAETAGDRMQLALAAVGEGTVLAARHRYAEAAQLVRDVLPTLDELDANRLGYAGAVNLLGQIAADTGAHAEAIAHYRKAFEIYQEIQRPRKAVQTLHNIALTHNQSGNPGAAIETVAQAYELLRPDEEVETWVKIYLTLGTAYFMLGDYAAARETFLKIDQAYLESNGLVNQLVYTTNNLGNVALKEKDWQLARDYLSYSISISRRAGLRIAQANTLGDLAEALVHLGEREKALQHLDEAVEILEEFPETAWARKRLQAILAQREELRGA